jgi:hypothetical protein
MTHMTYRTTLAALLAASALTACVSDSTASGGKTHSEDHAMRAIAAGQSTSMQQDETVRLPDGATLRYVGVPQDSRCPPNARCIRAGDADIEFVFAISGGPQATVKPNLPEAPSKNIGAWRLTVEDLAFGEGARPVTVRIDAAQ